MSPSSARDGAANGKFEPRVQLGKYPILRQIGRGATSHVYLARDPFADREVAIKVFLFDQHPDLQTERMMHKAFLAEASLAGKLNHPHIVDILDAVAEPDYSYLVMEYVAGTALDAHADVSSLLPLDKVVEIIFKCIRALEYAFQHGVIHRDIKPGNILLSAAGETKVSDFGASFQQRLGQETTQIAGVGSPAYMSPEQIRMEPLTQQTDIYSLGVTMYRLLTGRLPYQATTQAGLSYAILNTPPVRPAMLRPELPELLDKIVMTAIGKDPAQRYRSWLEFGKDLSQAFATLRLVGDSLSDSARFNELRQMAFFEGFGDVALWEVVRIGAWKNVNAGTVIIREGDHGDSFYLLIAGEVSVTLSGKNLNTVKPGRCFGEILYFTERVEQRTTTITALSDITVIEIKAAALRAATDACQVGLNKAFMRVLIERLMQANVQLAARG
ncbi:MAG: protein kinase [Betaproteobacteria bacterium]|nr:protein kinase [Gammaproteobacteria bacterium]MDH3435998.1 protein kinase [Betaproteobacteria bacterium]